MKAHREAGSLSLRSQLKSMLERPPPPPHLGSPSCLCLLPFYCVRCSLLDVIVSSKKTGTSVTCITGSPAPTSCPRRVAAPDRAGRPRTGAGTQRCTSDTKSPRQRAPWLFPVVTASADSTEMCTLPVTSPGRSLGPGHPSSDVPAPGGLRLTPLQPPQENQGTEERIIHSSCQTEPRGLHDTATSKWDERPL